MGEGVGERGEQAEQLAVGRLAAVFGFVFHHPDQPGLFGVGVLCGAGGFQQARAAATSS